MQEPASTETTRLLNLMSQGDVAAAGAVQALVYDQLRRIAQVRMNQERRDHTLQATALVNEAYLKLVGQGPIEWSTRAQFFAAAAESMRRILIDHARTRNRAKRADQGRRLPLDVVDLACDENLPEILALDEAICRLAVDEPEVARVVQLRFFAGLSVDETAEVMGIGSRSVDRYWTFARAWLFRALRDESEPDVEK